MRYISTRGAAPVLDFEEVTLAGLASDGGLYLPEAWPVLSRDEIAALAGLDYVETAVRVLMPFVGDSVDAAGLRSLCRQAYGRFAHAAVTPLVQLDGRNWLLELFHGPTLAFKDVALQLLGLLFERFLAPRDVHLTVIGATSGDTGSAAIDALAGRAKVDIFMLHPEGRVSEVQRRQMTTVLAPNVHNIAIDGSFDDAQALVKAMFAHQSFATQFSLSAVNSINWARLAAQVVYYFYAAVRLGAPERPVAFSVPTGNFGDVFAGYVAKRMGLPVERLVIATNINDILARTLATGVYEARGVVATTSPSMDIQVSSNFERLLFDALGRDPTRLRALMAGLAQSGRFVVDETALDLIRAEFDAGRADEAEVTATIARVQREAGYLLDPHTAIGVAVAGQLTEDRQTPMVVLGTAHPAKFPAAVKAASGIEPALPPHLADLHRREERFTVLANDQKLVEDFVRRHSRAAQGAAA